MQNLSFMIRPLSRSHWRPSRWWERIANLCMPRKASAFARIGAAGGFDPELPGGHGSGCAHRFLGSQTQKNAGALSAHFEAGISAKLTIARPTSRKGFGYGQFTQRHPGCPTEKERFDYTEDILTQITGSIGKVRHLRKSFPVVFSSAFSGNKVIKKSAKRLPYSCGRRIACIFRIKQYTFSIRKIVLYRLYPIKHQRYLLEQTLELCRLVYSETLATRKNVWEQEQKSLPVRHDQNASQLERTETGAFQRVLPVFGCRSHTPAPGLCPPTLPPTGRSLRADCL